MREVGPLLSPVFSKQAYVPRQGHKWIGLKRRSRWEAKCANHSFFDMRSMRSETRFIEHIRTRCSKPFWTHTNERSPISASYFERCVMTI
jgi:hypothetical protein